MANTQSEEEPMPKTVGRFTYDPKSGTLSGPKGYMESEDYRRCKSNLESGRNVVFNFGAREPGSDPVTLMLVAFQTDYAAWHGRTTFFASLEAAR